MCTLTADLYLNRMDLRRYCPNHAVPTDARTDAAPGAGVLCPDDCALLSPRQRHAFKVALAASDYLPAIPPLTVPRPIEPALTPVNEPDESALVLVSANNSLTFEVIMTVWAQGLTPAWFLLVNCLGNTVDMAMVFGEFKPQRLAESIEATALARKVAHRHLIVPGFTAPLAEDFRKATGWAVDVGPICAAELPLFLGDRWVAADAC